MRILALSALTLLSATLLHAAVTSASEEIIDFSIDSAGDVISTEAVQIDASKENALLVDTEKRAEVELFEIDGKELGNTRLTYSARMSSEDLKATEGTNGISYLRMVASFPDGEELIARGPRVPLKETTDWRPVDTVLYVDKGVSPERVRLELVVDGVGKVWIRDVKLFHRPLRTDYLLWGHVVVWLVLIIYIYHLVRKEQRLTRELRTLRQST